MAIKMTLKINKRINPTPEQIEKALKIASEIEKIENERNTIFIILWVGIGILFSALLDSLIFAWVLAIVISAIYSKLLHKRNELKKLREY